MVTNICSVVPFAAPPRVTRAILRHRRRYKPTRPCAAATNCACVSVEGKYLVAWILLVSTDTALFDWSLGWLFLSLCRSGLSLV